MCPAHVATLSDRRCVSERDCAIPPQIQLQKCTQPGPVGQSIQCMNTNYIATHCVVLCHLLVRKKCILANCIWICICQKHMKLSFSSWGYNYISGSLRKRELSVLNQKGSSVKLVKICFFCFTNYPLTFLQPWQKTDRESQSICRNHPLLFFLGFSLFIISRVYFMFLLAISWFMLQCCSFLICVVTPSRQLLFSIHFIMVQKSIWDLKVACSR